MNRRQLTAVVVLAGLSIAGAVLSPVAHADDVADEADLQFQLGATRYKAGDFLGALEHFLASNRLAPNHNVVFNIARCYERLERYADAYRSYAIALEGEQNPDKRKSISDSLAEITPKVAVLDVETDPPGATIYLNRKDLGARGAAPRLFGLSAGKYTVIAELAGYEAKTSGEVTIAVGTKTTVNLALVPLLATVTVTGAAATGASVRVDDANGKAECVAPCSVKLLPGHHTLFLTREGFQRAEVPLDLAPKATLEVRPPMSVQTGSVVVNCDLRGALIEVDGKSMGFTPAVVQVPLGDHQLKISLAGYRPEERLVKVGATGDTTVEVQLTESSEVIAASRAAESVEDAPASVTIIPKYELLGMGYPTIAEALRGVRGVYVNDDRSYSSLGFRGFAHPGDYGNRVLVTIDGQPTNDNYIGSSYVGFDGRVDLDDVDRIEVIRGPGSALYGTSAFFGVVNLVTRSRNSPTHVEAGVSAVEYGVLRGRIHATYKIDDEAGFWMSLSGARTPDGRDFTIAEYATDGATGQSIGNDGFNAGTLSGRAWWKSLTFQWFYTARKKRLPTGIYDSDFPSHDTTFFDRRAFGELRFEKAFGETLVLSRAHVNVYNFDQQLAYPNDPANDTTGYETDSFRGTWFGLEQRAAAALVPNRLRVTVGGEGQYHLKTHQFNSTEFGGSLLDRNDPFWLGTGYLLADWTPTSGVKISPAARADYYSTVGFSVNPRLAIALHATPTTTVKILGGKAFRVPSVYELFFVSGAQRAPSSLKPEEIYSGELELNQRFSSTVSATLAGYVNYVHRLIVLQGGGSTADQNYYANSDFPVLSSGFEGEIRRDFRQGWMISAQISLQKTRYLHAGSERREVPNSPELLAGAKVGIPILQKVLGVMSRWSLLGPRWDRNEKAADPPQGKLDGALVWDVVFGGEAEHLGVRYGLGVYNVLDTRWATPVSGEFRHRTMVQSGRTLYLSLAVTI